jgi:hypothetical protein
MPHRSTRWLAGAAFAAVTVTSLALTPPPAQARPLTADATAVPAYTPPPGVTDPCQAATAGTAGCAVLTAAPGTHKAAAVPAVGTTPTGYTPANLASAYQLPSAMATGAKVAVVTAYDDPNAAADLATYRTEYGLAACTTASGCFAKVNQTGGTTYPKTSAGWSAGAAESIDMISAICPTCDIILVEASSSAITALGTAENEAVALGAKFIDNDWTIPESEIGSAETTYDADYFDHPGVAITAPAGDGGYGVSYPAASPYVTAVGGTTLTADSTATRGWDESTWSGTGSGCSAIEPKPTWQTDTGCTTRTDNDAAAVADPSTPVAYYDTPTAGGWGTGSGTAVAAALIAAAYALAGAPAPGSTPASYLYTHPGALHNITTGTNGTCSVTYLCTAGTGYSGPAGMGTPYADTAFHTVGARPVAISAGNGTTWVFALGTSGAIEDSSRASKSTTWSSLTSLGGTWSGYPGALAASDGSVWVFALSGGNLYADHLPSGSTTWSGWTEIGNSGDSLTGTPTTVQEKNGNIDVFTRDAVTGHLFEVQLVGGTGTWSGFANLGGTLPNDVGAVVGGGGWMYVMAVSSNSELYYDGLPPNGSWSGWTLLSSTPVTGVPKIIQDAAGTDRVYVRQASNGAILESTLPTGTSTWSTYDSLGGTLINDAAALGGTGGTVFVFEIGGGTYINYDKLPSGGTYGGWTGIASGFVGVPAVVEDSAGAADLFAGTSAGTLEVDILPSGTSAWPAFTSLGGTIAGS